jgi:MoaA/NifB/PqqE/SkfB family radical SAM enzyme
MNEQIHKHIQNVLHHIYISPLEQCNLQCQMCYTTKTTNQLSNEEILSFVRQYHQTTPIQSITFCGGEVFILPKFHECINQITDLGIFVQIITNGTIDQLNKISQPNLVNLIVSIDGLESNHNANRGAGKWRQSMNFLKKALRTGFHAEVFCIVTQENQDTLDEFESLITKETGHRLDVTYHPRKPSTYLRNHPISNQQGKSDGFTCLTCQQRQSLGQQKHVFPNPNLGCYQIALMSDGNVYGCCEGIRPLGTIHNSPKELIATLNKRLDEWQQQFPHDTSLGCVEPQFVCGLEEYLCPNKE